MCVSIPLIANSYRKNNEYSCIHKREIICLKINLNSRHAQKSSNS